MHIFITGATGYIGGAVAARLLADGHRVSGLARTPEKGRALAARGIAPVVGALADLATLSEAAQAADAVINAASADNSMVAHVLVQALEGSGKPLLHTSGTSVAADRALGERSDVVFTEDMPLQTLPERLLRVAVERSVLAAAGRGVRSVVIRPSSASVRHSSPEFFSVDIGQRHSRGSRRLGSAPQALSMVLRNSGGQRRHAERSGRSARFPTSLLPSQERRLARQ